MPKEYAALPENEVRRSDWAVTEMGRLLPASEALEFSVEYAGVVVFGTAVIIKALSQLTTSLAPPSP
jgi:hypothetical protein